MDRQMAEILSKLSATISQINNSSASQMEDLKMSLDNLAHRIDQLSWSVNKVEKTISKFSKNITSKTDSAINASQLAALNLQYEKLSHLPGLKPAPTLASNGQAVAEDGTVYHTGQRPIQPGPAPYKPPPPKNTLRIIQSVPHLGQDAANKKYPLHKQAMLPVFVNDSHFHTTVIPVSGQTKGEPPTKTMRISAQSAIQSMESMQTFNSVDGRRNNGATLANSEELTDPSTEHDPNRTIPKPYYMSNGKRRIKKLEWKDIQELALNQGNLAPISAKVSLDKLRNKSQNIINLCYNRLSTPENKILYWKAVDPDIRKEMSDQLETFGQAVGIPLNRCEGRWASYWILYQNWRNHSDYQLKLLKNNKIPKSQANNTQNGESAESNSQAAELSKQEDHEEEEGEETSFHGDTSAIDAIIQTIEAAGATDTTDIGEATETTA